jgi:uncharacterized repeat protein (TIGR01451 family)
VKTFLRVWFCLVIALVATAGSGVATTTPAGTVISNTASMTYSDRNGVAESVTSNTVAATVATVSAVAVGPNEKGCNPSTDSVPVNQPFVRTFTVSNNGNAPDKYTVTASTTAGSVTSLSYASSAGGAPTPLQNGGTLPKLTPGESVQVSVTVNPGSASIGTDVEVSLAATSTLPGGTVATASQCAVLAAGAALSGPGGPGTPILKLVNGQPSVAAQPGATVTYSIQFLNYGTLPATNVVVTDVVPAGITPNPSSVLVNGAAAPPQSISLQGQTLTVTIPTVAGGALDTITFSASIGTSATLGATYVNTVTVASSQTTGQQSTQASVLVGTGNIVYDGLGGSSVPVAGAIVTLTSASGQPVALPGAGQTPNTGNANPYTTGANGAYSFALGPKQTGPITYILTITAPGYLNRRFQLVLTPNAAGNLYTVTITSLDGQLLAVPGGFALTKGPVTLSNIYGLFGNLPMFRSQSIQVTKAVDRSFASSGDRLVYTITFNNVGTALGATTIVDTLPPNVVYAPGTGRVNNLHQEPKVSGRVLTWTLPALNTQNTITYAAVILPGTEENTTLTNNVTVRAAAPNENGVFVSGSANVQTQVVAGVFTDSTIITGRVFYDIRRTGEFDPGDVGIAGVRIYLEDGESVVTDSTGRYDFPGVRPGMHVLRIDTSSLPPTAHPYPDRSLASDDQRSIRRLVHGVFDGGVIQDINFALEGAP